MRRHQFPGKQYMGNSSSKEIHDLDREDTSAGGCQIDDIIEAGHAVVFRTDTLTEAYEHGYDNCDKCLGNSKR